MLEHLVPRLKSSKDYIKPSQRLSVSLMRSIIEHIISCSEFLYLALKINMIFSIFGYASFTSNFSFLGFTF